MLTLLKTCRTSRILPTTTSANFFSTQSQWNVDTRTKAGQKSVFHSKRGSQIVTRDTGCLRRELHTTSELQSKYDIIIVGAGAVGCSTAFWLKQRVGDSCRIAVTEKDSSYSKSTSVLSLGGIRQQFSLPENIQMSMFAMEFLRNIEKHLKVEDLDLPDIRFHTHGYLFLASEASAEQMTENHRTQIELGAKVELFSPSQLKTKFPWLNTDDIALASLGIENEGCFDPWSLIRALKSKAQSMGVDFLDGKVVEFNYNKDGDGANNKGTRELSIKQPDGDIKKLEFEKLVIAAGSESGKIGRLLGIGKGPGLLEFSIPIDRRKRYVYVTECKGGPGIEQPLVVDPTGAYMRRENEDLYVMGMSPEEHEEPECSNLEVDYEFFESTLWPIMAHRVPAFNALKLKSAWAGFYDYNILDQNAIVGSHPCFPDVFICAGFSGHGIQMSTAVGKAITELIVDKKFSTIDLTRFGFDRVIQGKPIIESGIV